MLLKKYNKKKKERQRKKKEKGEKERKKKIALPVKANREGRQASSYREASNPTPSGDTLLNLWENSPAYL